MKTAVMSLSGGMDSTALLLRLIREGYDVYAISYNYGQKHIIELDRAKANIEYLSENNFHVNHQLIDLSGAMSLFASSLIDKNTDVPEGFYEEEQMKSTVVPNRNAIFSSILYGYALSIAKQLNCNVVITLGVHSGDHAIYPDCRPEFYQSLEKSFDLGNWDSDKVRFDLPYIDGDKVTILQDAQESCQKLNLNFETVFANTSTSYDPDEYGRASGKTGSDIERILAFYKLGMPDPVEYQEDWGKVLQNALDIESDFKDKEYQKRFDNLTYSVTRKGATERPFTGKYNKESRKGIYRCICCGLDLFDSSGKYDSGCGWPAFHTELENANIDRINDYSHGMTRVEIKCSNCDSHLGHVFNDGPKHFGGERYCVNSVSLDFEVSDDDDNN